MEFKLNKKRCSARVIFLTLFILLQHIGAIAQNSIAENTPWIFNDQVWAIANDSVHNVIYVGGNFTNIGRACPYNTAIGVNDVTGANNLNFLSPNNIVTVSIPDGNGGWYIGGDFTMVGSQTRNHLAQINASGQLTSWDPNANGAVRTLAISGGIVYVGGSFTSIGGLSRNRIAALDEITGLPTSWNPNSSESIYSLAISGNTIYVGGNFTTIGGQSRNKLAALDIASGLSTSWNPGVTGNGNFVNAIAVNGSNIYVGGSFTTIGGFSRNNIAALDISTGLATPWNPNANQTIFVLVVSGGVIYVGGDFSNIGGQIRNHIASIDIVTGVSTSWNPNIGGSVQSIAISGNLILAGGSFVSVGGQSRNRAAALDASTGFPTGWNPSLGGIANTISISDNIIYIGGDFNTIDTKPRNYIASIDATTGVPTAWNPGADGTVTNLVINDTTIYVGGFFFAFGNQSRTLLASVNANTGAITSWDPEPDDIIRSLAVNNGIVYLGGDFTTIGSQPRNRIAAVSASTGLATSWNPNVNNSICELAFSGNKVYVGGFFTSIGGQSRNRLAAIDISTGLVTSWNPNSNSAVRALISRGNTIYAAGDFSSIGGQVRDHLVAIDGISGLPTSWNPGSNGNITLLTAGGGDKLYAGGSFTAVGGQFRNQAAAIDVNTGIVTPWNPNINTSAGDVNDLTVSGNAVYIGGGFAQINGEFNPYYAKFSVCSKAPKKPGAIAQSGGATKVCPSETRRFSIAGVENAYTYNWTVPTGATITSGQGTTSVLISFDNSYASTDTIKVRAESDCGSSAYRFLVVRRGSTPPAPGIITQTGGDPKICPGQTRTFTTTPAADITNYTWTVPTGATITSSQGTTSIVVSFNGSLAAVDTVKVASVNGCGASVNRILKIYRGSGPHAPGVITQSGAAKICPGEARTYTIAAVPGAASYSWVVPTGASITSGQGTTSINVSFNGLFGASDTIKVRTGDACGNSAYRLKIVTRDAAPKAPSAIAGETKGLCDQDGVAYSVTNTAGNTYAWSFNNANGSVATGQGTSAITANFTPGASSTTLSVTAANGCGTSAPRAAVFSAKPAKPASMTGASAVCAHAMGVQYSTPVVYGATSYTWGAPSGSKISDGVVTSTGVILTTTSHTVTVNFGATAGDVKVRADNSCASSGFFFKPVTMGCKTIEEAEGSDDIIVYPNPATDQVNITFQSHNPGSSYSIHLYDVLGKEVIITQGTTIIGTNQTTLNTSILASGVYHLVLKGEGLDYNTKVVLDK